MSFTSVNMAELQAAQTTIDKKWMDISTEMNDLKSWVANLAKDWQGDSAQRYQAYQAEWDAAANNLADTLQRIGLAVGSARDNYLEAETTNSRRFG
jgi:WXG100 family type VII secretion target